MAKKDTTSFEQGYCKSATLEEIQKHSHVLTPGRYVGIPDEEDDLPAPKPGEFYVYAIKCDDGSVYIGQTYNIPRRWNEHVTGKGAQDKMADLTATLKQQMNKEAELNQEIATQLSKIGFAL